MTFSTRVHCKANAKTEKKLEFENGDKRLLSIKNPQELLTHLQQHKSSFGISEGLLREIISEHCAEPQPKVNEIHISDTANHKVYIIEGSDLDCVIVTNERDKKPKLVPHELGKQIIAQSHSPNGKNSLVIAIMAATIDRIIAKSESLHNSQQVSNNLDSKYHQNKAENNHSQKYTTNSKQKQRVFLNKKYNNNPEILIRQLNETYNLQNNPQISQLIEEKVNSLADNNNNDSHIKNNSIYKIIQEIQVQIDNLQF